MLFAPRRYSLFDGFVVIGMVELSMSLEADRMLRKPAAEGNRLLFENDFDFSRFTCDEDPQ